MSYKERIQEYLWSIAPAGATNGQIARALGISSQQTVYMTTQELAGRQLIRAAREGATWVFFSLDASADHGEASRVPAASAALGGGLTPVAIDALIETLYESFKAGEGVTLRGFGSFYVRPERSSWVFRFNPGQRLRALFGWSSSYKGER